jgi:hypothetical protein
VSYVGTGASGIVAAQDDVKRVCGNCRAILLRAPPRAWRVHPDHEVRCRQCEEVIDPEARRRWIAGDIARDRYDVKRPGQAAEGFIHFECAQTFAASSKAARPQGHDPP